MEAFIANLTFVAECVQHQVHLCKADFRMVLETGGFSLTALEYTAY